MYLPCWTDGLSFREQYDAYWIADEFEKALKNSDDTSFYSFLPIRFFVDPYSKGFYRLSSVGHYRDGFELCRTSKIRHSSVEFAFQIWKTAAEIVKKEYPEIEKISFDNQLNNGVYPIRFAYSLNEIKDRQTEIMKELINNGFTVDEYLTVSYLQEERRKIWHYQGIVGESSFECDKVFLSTPYGEMMPLTLRENVSYSFEECEKYFRTFDENILQLGNQVRVYQKVQNENTAFFDAIEEKSMAKIKEYVEKGYSLNAIGINGNSAFAAILYSLDYLENYEDIGPEKMIFLDYLFEHGANPAIYGVNAFGCLLVEAAVYHINKLAGWLLQRGVNPAIYPFIDDLSDEDITLIDWVEDDVMSEDIRDIPDDDVKDLLRMLKEYS